MNRKKNVLSPRSEHHTIPAKRLKLEVSSSELDPRDAVLKDIEIEKERFREEIDQIINHEESDLTESLEMLTDSLKISKALGTLKWNAQNALQYKAAADAALCQFIERTKVKLMAFLTGMHPSWGQDKFQYPKTEEVAQDAETSSLTEFLDTTQATEKGADADFPGLQRVPEAFRINVRNDLQVVRKIENPFVFCSTTDDELSREFALGDGQSESVKTDEKHCHPIPALAEDSLGSLADAWANFTSSGDLPKPSDCNSSRLKAVSGDEGGEPKETLPNTGEYSAHYAAVSTLVADSSFATIELSNRFTYRMNEQQQSEYICNECLQMRRKKKPMVDHIWVNHCGGHFNCLLCPTGRRFHSRSGICQHIKRIHFQS